MDTLFFSFFLLFSSFFLLFLQTHNIDRGTKTNTVRWREFLTSFTGLGPTKKSTTASKKKKTAAEKGTRRHAGGSNVDPMERQLRKILNAAKKKGLKLEDSFSHFDKNGQGLINRLQFKNALRELGFQASDRDMECLMTRFDNNGDGQITIKEFAEFATAPDVDGNMSAAEKKLHKILDSAHNQGLDYEEAFESFDADGDGQISKSEFSRAIQDIFRPTKIELDRAEIDVLGRLFVCLFVVCFLIFGYRVSTHVFFLFLLPPSSFLFLFLFQSVVLISTTMVTLQ